MNALILWVSLGLASTVPCAFESKSAGCPECDCCGCCETGTCECAACTCECCVDGVPSGDCPASR
jgi:hypothetical protein